jgi:toxin ParE1/3/4
LSPRRILLSATAVHDVDVAFDHYAEQAGMEVAHAFIDALGACYRHIALHPGTGSPRYAQKLDVPGLRSWGVGRFPYLVFYFDMPGRIDVVRVIHGAMDISHALRVQEPAAEYAVNVPAEWDLR